MKKIETLIPDILSAVDKGVSVDPGLVEEFGADLARTVQDRLDPDLRQSQGYLRPSNIGTDCDRQLWYQVNAPEKGEPLDPVTRIKFLLGDIIEAFVLFLAKTAGHSVEGQQDQVEINGVKGSRDAVIDGVLTDVKSASSYSFQKFQKGLTPETDAFGYLKQINFYLEASQDDPLVTDKDRAAFLAMDKQMGKLTLDIHQKANIDYEELIQQKRKMLASSEPPPRGYEDVPQSATSPNRKLGTACSYCAFRQHCWPGLRSFLYSGKVEHLTVVKKEPKVSELFR